MTNRRSWIRTASPLLILILLFLAFAVTSAHTTTPSREARACTDPEPALDRRGAGKARWSKESANEPLGANASWACLPHYGEPHFILTVNDTSSSEYEPFVTSGDFNGDGLDDVVITKMTFQTFETYELDVLINDGNGSLMLRTSSMFLRAPPAVQHPAQVVVADFNGDGASDIFVADSGYDDYPHPGYQNQLALSAPGGKLVDATGNLPQRDTMTHSACAADVDADKDIDLYVGNFWGQNDVDP